MYVYALILAGTVNCSPLEIATWIAADHGIPDFIICAEKLAYAFKLLTNRKPLIDKVETDFSLVLLQCMCKAFNGMKLSVYLQQVYDEMTNRKPKSALMVLHICSSHLLKTALKNIKTYFFDDDVIRLAGKDITKLIHATTLNEAANVFRHLVVVFGTEYSSKNFTKSAKDLLKDSKKSEETEKEYIEHDFDSSIHNDCKKDSPFYKYFDEVYKTTLINIDLMRQKNKQYSPDFMNYLMTTLMPYFPLWSALMIKEFKITRDTNATVENWWKIEKFFNFDGVKKILAPRYIQEKESVLEQRLRERELDLVTTRQDRNKIKKKKTVKKETVTIKKKKLQKVTKPKKQKRKFELKKKLLNKLKKEEDDEQFPEECWKRSNKKKSYFETSKLLGSNKNKISIVDVQDEIPDFRETVEILQDISEITESKINIDSSAMGEDKNIQFDFSKVEIKNASSSMIEIKDNNLKLERNHQFKDKDLESDKCEAPTNNKDKIFSNCWQNFLSQENTYPLNFPKIKKSLDGLNINDSSMGSLNPNQYVDDNIINAFHRITTNASQFRFILAFDLYLTDSIIRNSKLSSGFHNYMSSIEFTAYKIFLFPIHLIHSAHYTLLVIIPEYELFIYLDSIYGMPPRGFVEKMMAVYQKYMSDKRKVLKQPVNWEK